MLAQERGRHDHGLAAVPVHQHSRGIREPESSEAPQREGEADAVRTEPETILPENRDHVEQGARAGEGTREADQTDQKEPDPGGKDPQLTPEWGRWE